MDRLWRFPRFYVPLLVGLLVLQVAPQSAPAILPKALGYRNRLFQGASQPSLPGLEQRVASQAQAGYLGALAAACGDGVHPSNEWVNFYSSNSTLDGSAVPVGTCVEAYVGSLKIGFFVVTTAGRYGFLSAYRDDPVTPQKDGALPGEAVTFTINGYPATVAGGNPTWTTNGARIVADLTAITLPGDVDADCDVDIVDIMLVASRWNTALGDPRYDPRYDVDGDGDIDIVDIMLVASHWNETCNGAATTVAARFAQARSSRL